MKIKILHITQSNCGVEEYLKLYFNYMDKDIYEFELICPPYTDMVKNITSLGVKVFIVDMKREISIFHDIKSFAKITNYIRMSNPDVVHVHSSKAGVLGRLAAYINKIPCVYTAHGWSFEMDCSKYKKELYAMIERFCAKITYKIINISDYEEKLALKYKIAPEGKLITIYNGIDIKRYETDYNKADILKELNIPKDSYIIGMVARLTSQKSPETFIKIAKSIYSEIPNSYFILVGDGELRQEIEMQIEENDLQHNFLITGWTNVVPMYVSIFDIALLTSKWEGFGLVLAEYMAARKPVIASNVGGIPNVIKSYHNGILVEPGDIDGFKDAILKLKGSDKIRKYFINNSTVDVKLRFDIKRVVKEHSDLYFKLLEDNVDLVHSYKNIEM